MDKLAVDFLRGWFMKRVLAVVCLIACCSPSPAQEKSKSKITQAGTEVGESANLATAKLPVRRVVLYKNGVGYFEHLGHVRGNQDVHVDFTSAQLNDVLKSLTVLDLSGGRITGVDYNSEAPLALRLATLRLALGERPTMAEFLGALRGARLEVRSGNGPALVGKLLSVERKTRTGAGAGGTVEIDEISVITDTGEVRSVDLGSATSVRIAEKDLQAEVGRYMNLMVASRDQDVRRMTISTTGTGERNLYLSYISEVPIWKTTYRIVLPAKADKKPLLQGWAIVDKTVGEDWDGVQLSLVAGAPHSFIQQLSESFYWRRPVVALPESVQLSPQTHAATLMRGNGRLTGTVEDPSGAPVSGASVRLLDEQNGVIAETTTESNGQYTFSGVFRGTYRVEVQRQGFQKNVIAGLNIAPGENQVNSQLRLGSSAETVEVSANTITANTESAMLVGAAKPSAVANRPHVGSGAGSGSGAGMLRMAPSAPPPPSPARLAEAGAQGEAAASGQDLGDLFAHHGPTDGDRRCRQDATDDPAGSVRGIGACAGLYRRIWRAGLCGGRTHTGNRSAHGPGGQTNGRYENDSAGRCEAECHRIVGRRSAGGGARQHARDAGVW